MKGRSNRLVIGLCVIAFLHGGSSARGDECVYVANSGSDYVSVIESATRTNVASLGVEGAPIALAAAPGNHVLYVLTQAGGDLPKVVILSTDTGAILRSIPGLPACAYSLLLSSDASTAYVPDYCDNSITALDISSGQARQIAAIGGDQYTGLPVPTHLALSPDGSLIYAPLPQKGVGTLSVIDVASGSTTKVSFLPEMDLPEPTSVLLSGDGSLVYVLLRSGGGVIPVLDAATNVVVKTVRLPAEASPSAVALSPDGQVLFAADAGTIFSVNLATSDVSSQNLAASHGAASLAVSSSGVFVAQYETATVSVANLDNNIVEATIPVGEQPMDIVAVNAPGSCRPAGQTPISTATALPTATPTPVSGDDCQEGMTCLIVASLSARAGDEVTIEVRIRAGGAQITGIQNDLALDSVASFDRCTGAASVDVANFHQEPSFVRAVLFEQSDRPFLDDAVLYTCTARISPTAEPGSYGLDVSNVVASDSSGERVAISGKDGRLDILAPLEGTRSVVSGPSGSTSGCQVDHSAPHSSLTPLLLFGLVLGCGIMRTGRSRRD